MCIKDLRLLGNRQLKNIVIVDNLVHSFGIHLENGIPILEYHGQDNDEELKHLQKYLVRLSKAKDIRAYNKKYLKLHLLDRFSLKQLINIL